MMRWFAVAVGLLLLAGCASRWEHATKRPSEFYADDRECQVEAGGAMQSLEQGRDSVRTSYEGCMWERGWRQKKSVWFFDPQ